MLVHTQSMSDTNQSLKHMYTLIITTAATLHINILRMQYMYIAVQLINIFFNFNIQYEIAIAKLCNKIKYNERQ